MFLCNETIRVILMYIKSISGMLREKEKNKKQVFGSRAVPPSYKKEEEIIKDEER
jgi:hypothetical protein